MQPFVSSIFHLGKSFWDSAFVCIRSLFLLISMYDLNVFIFHQLVDICFHLYAKCYAKSLQSCPTLCDPIWEHTKSLQSCPALCDSMDCIPPGSSVHRILQARILEWVAMPSSGGIFPTLRSKQRLLHLLHWQAGPLPTAPPGKPSLSGWLILGADTSGDDSFLEWENEPCKAASVTVSTYIWFLALSYQHLNILLLGLAFQPT